MQFQFVAAGKFGEFFVRLGLIPKRHGRDVVLQRQIAPARLPAEVLNGDFEIVLETNRVGNVPAIEAETLLRIIQAIRPDDLRQAGSKDG